MMFVSIGLGAVVALALIVVVSILTGGTVKSNDQAPVNVLVGKSVRSFTLSGLTSGTVTAPWASGHAGVLIFFASWCEPCKAEMPKVAAYLRSHNEAPIQIIGIDTNDRRSSGQGFVTSSGVTFPIAFDPNTTVSSGVFNFQAIPETVFVNAKGVVTQVYTGAIPKDQLIKGIAALRAA
jgi:cytochrome c biogenesis protein CcmG/thiol:disulfide interchange protein DsbE